MPSSLPAPPFQERVTMSQVASMVFFFTICVTPFTLAPLLVPALGRSVWLATLPMIGVGLLGGWAAVRLAGRFPGQSVLEYAPRVLGRAAGWVFRLALAATMTGGALVNMHTLLNTVAGALLPQVPQWVPAALATALVGYGVTVGIAGLTRWADMQLYLLVPVLIVILGAPWVHAVPGRLLPPQVASWGRFFTSGTAIVLLGACRGFVPILFLGGPAQAGGRGLLRPCMVALIAGCLITTVLMAMVVAVLGPADAAQVRFPILTTESTFIWRWFPVQRYGHLTALAWISLGLTVDAVYAQFAGQAWASLWGGRDARLAALAVAVAMLVYGSERLVPTTSAAVLEAWSWMVLGATVVVPLAMLLLPARPRAPA